MVVIRDTKTSLGSTFGKSFTRIAADFSDVIGYSIEEEGDEYKVEFNPDRPDLFSFHSMEHAMKCFYDKNYWILEKPVASGIKFRVSDSVRSLRKYAIAFIVQGKAVSDNLDHIIEYQERIHETIGKDRTKVSIGLHDLDKLKPPFDYKAVKKTQINFTTYDGAVSGTADQIIKEHPKGIEFGHLIDSDESVPVILDSEGDVLSLPPVINGAKSRVDVSTRRFFVDITGNDRKATRDAFFLLQYEFRYLGYTIQAVDVEGNAYTDLDADRYDGRIVGVDSNEMKRITGMTISQKKAIELLRKMGYMAEPSSRWIDVRVPGNRIDVMGQVDIIEDMVKAYGLAHIKEKKIDLPLIGKPDRSNDFSALVRDSMVGIGLQEVRTFVVSSSQYYKDFTYRGGYDILNPKSLDYSVIRDRLNINILELFRINKRRPLPHKVFEIGEVYSKGRQETRFCAMIMDSKASYSSIKQVLDYLAARLGIESVEIKQTNSEGFISGRTGEVNFNGKAVGVIGEMDPEVLVRFDLNAPVSAVELDLAEVEKQVE